MSKVDLDDETLRTILAKAVLDTITEEKRSELIINALKDLIAVPPAPSGPYGYDKKKSKLEEHFDFACNQAARETCKAEMEKPENRKAIEDMVVAAFQKMLTDEARREKAIIRMADALTAAMVDKEYR